MNVGLVYLSIYPYSGIQSSCGIKDNGSDESVITRLSSCVSVTSYSELSLRSAVAVSPVAVEMSANSFGFLQYAGGVYDGLDCDPEAIDHAVAVTGFDFALDYDSNGLAFNSTFWLLANSFGPWWGEGGNMRIARLPGDTSAGPCGMYTFPSYPLL
jgi:cathepsin L